MRNAPKTGKFAQFFQGLGVAFSALIFTLGIFSFVLLAARFVRTRIEIYFEKRVNVARRGFFYIPEKPKKETSKEASEIKKETQEDNLIQGSFSDLFSGEGYVNTDKTTMYQDMLVTSFIFPPNFEWQEAEERDAEWIEKNPDGVLMRCILNRCLSQKEKKLFFFSSGESYESHEIGLPGELANKNLINISIASLDSKWLLGAVIKENSKYIGFVFSFDGKYFSPVFTAQNTPFISVYEGALGFGGIDNDWLAIYGAYESIAYRVRPIGPIGPISPINVSRFFGYRVMNYGFEPAILRVSAFGKVNWYIFSLTENNPKFIKLFQNNSDEIVGAVDFTNLIGLQDNKYIFFAPAAEPNTLFVKIKDSSGAESFRAFKDKGFKKDKELEIVSLDVFNAPAHPAKIKKAKILDLDFESKGASIQLLLSNNGEEWYQTKIGETVEFKDQKGPVVLWRAILKPDSNPQTSPFFDKINIQYKLQYL